MEPIFLKSLKKIVEGTGGRKPGKIRTEVDGKREEEERDAGVMRGRDAEEDYFLVCFLANFKKSEPKNIHYLLV